MTSAIPIPDARMKELRELAARLRPERVAVSCDQLQADMDKSFGSSFSDPAAGLGYFIDYIWALSLGCAFLKNYDPAFTDPTTGKQFQMQVVANSWDVRGSKLYMEGSYLWADDINRKGNTDSGKDIYDLFQLVPAGFKASVAGDKRDAYYILVASGAQAGKYLTGQTDGDGYRWIVAQEYGDDKSTLDVWTLSRETYAKDNNEASGKAIDNIDASGNHLGRLDDPNDKGGRRMQVYGTWNGKANQLFHFRPEGYIG
ncbi:hypothetical protein ACFVXG_35885 [Kitasatospora sp. NPDC058162]|uniref:hypothetical protein n=1 Tax=Kitasatospora sp. NPDC058162 TaxID=3346362 RepID=UPI0036D979E5